ncbi:MAG: hypothetical protein ACLGHZ_06720 [Actinomycetes bacterium]
MSGHPPRDVLPSGHRLRKSVPDYSPTPPGPPFVPTWRLVRSDPTPDARGLLRE